MPEYRYVLFQDWCFGAQVKLVGGLVTCKIAVVGLRRWEWKYMLELGYGSLYNTCLN